MSTPSNYLQLPNYLPQNNNNNNSPFTNANNSVNGEYVADKIKLMAKTSSDTVIFEASPEIEENGTAIYTTLDDIRAPASYSLYAGSPSRTFSLNAQFISRTAEEAENNYKYKSLLQAWRTPIKTFGGIESGPETLILYGYGKNFFRIPVYVNSVNFSFPSDVDYVRSTSGVPMPIVMPVSLTLREARTVQDLQAFNYEQFKAGILPGWN